MGCVVVFFFFFFQAEDGIRDLYVTGVQTCALPISERRAEVPRFNAGGAPGRDTTHVSVIDAEGNCVTMTHSLGMPSGVVTEGLGFMYNGCMGVFDPRPGRAGSLAPGKARFSSVVPSIVYESDRPHIIIGAPGATHIAMGVL